MTESRPDFVDQQPPAMVNGLDRPVPVESADLGALLMAELEWKAPDQCVAADFAGGPSSDYQIHSANLSPKPAEPLLN